MPIPESTQPHVIHVPPWPAPTKPAPTTTATVQHVFVPASRQARSDLAAATQQTQALPQLPTAAEAATFLGIGFGFFVGTAIVVAAIGAFVLGFFLYGGCRMSRLFFGRIDAPTQAERIQSIRDRSIVANLAKLEYEPLDIDMR